MKKCPMCAEEIQDEAVKCRHCGAFINQSGNAVPFQPASSPRITYPFYFQVWFIILTLIIFFPIGLILMWLGKRFPLWVRIIISCFFGLFVVRAVLSSYSQNSKQTSTEVVETIEPQNEPKQEVRTIQLQEPFRLGNFTYKIMSFKFLSRVGSQFFKHDAPEGGTLLVVHYTLMNESNQTQTIMNDDFIVIDSQNRQFRPSSEAGTAYLLAGGDKTIILSEVQPGLQRKMTSIYEIPLPSKDGPLGLIVPEKGLLGNEAEFVRLQ